MPSPCEECGKEFGTARQLRSHREVHQLSAELRLRGALVKITRVYEEYAWECLAEGCSFSTFSLPSLRRLVKSHDLQTDETSSESAASFEQQSHAISAPNALDLLATASLRRRRSASSDSQSDAPPSPTRPTQRRRFADVNDVDSVSDSSSPSERGRSAGIQADVSDEARLASAHLYHLAALRVVVCTRCKIVLGPRHAASHPRQKHSCETDRLQRVLNALHLVNPTAADIVPLPASTPHLQRAPPHASRPPSFIISRNPLLYAPIDQQLHPSTDTRSSEYYRQRYEEYDAYVSGASTTCGTPLWSKILSCTSWHVRLGVTLPSSRDGDEGSGAGAVARMKA